MPGSIAGQSRDGEVARSCWLRKKWLHPTPHAMPAALRGYVLGDAVYGSDRKLRRMLEGRGKPYVLSVRSNEFMRVGGIRKEQTLKL